MDVSTVVSRLKEKLNGFKLIGGVADLDASSKGVIVTPACFVLPTRESAVDIDQVGAFEQALTIGFGIAIAVSSRRDPVGAAALDYLDDLRKQIKAALNAWVPQPENGEPVRFESGSLVRFEDGVIWWLDEYRVVTYERIL